MADQREEERREDDELIIRQPKCKEFRAATPRILSLLSATDKLGQIGEGEEESEEEENKERLISGSKRASVREGREKWENGIN